ncbi:MAG: MarR family winged helix-turn-helix transcriptional regulator [Candidatus Limimorpha sp.]|nr:MarR family transcriptional regulator [Bacteroidales bacterium]MCI7377790.1 MarR family transcriptional regulator [Bacteroidales bacterium]MDD5979471.1 MarR family transcriptional regulator [Bacteroidales bacterium]MDD7276844.1 MarR family transcriptional regulator [Bacteroidales bacterium]MDY6075134.1 MarR family transcriptional regulator [Bacteroidales bacterium]
MLIIKKIAVYINILNSRIKKHFDDRLEENNINMTPEQYLVMDILWDEQSLSQQRIADIIQKDKNSVTKFIDSLEKKNLVFRTVDANDRRINKIELTEEGRRLKEPTTQVAIKFMNDTIAGIDDSDLETFVRVLQQIKNNLDKNK